MNQPPNLQEEANPLLNIFPAEVWTLILDKIQNPHELRNALDADPFFILLCKAKEHTWRSILLGLVFPKVQKYLNPNDILKCRRVCKRLKISVDTFLEAGQKQFYSTDRHNSPQNSQPYVGLSLWTLGSMLDPQQFHCLMKEMRMFPRAKIVGGFVKCSYISRNFVKKSQAFFQEHGQKILHLFLSFGLSESGITPLDLVNYIHQNLDNTTNLKSLTICLPQHAQNQLGVPYCLWVDRISQHFHENPLPAMPNLTSLSLGEAGMDGWTGSAFVHQGIVEAYKDQLHKLDLIGILISIPQNMELLTDLHIHVRNVLILDSLRNIRAPLQKVCLIFTNESPLVRVGEMLQILQSCRSTLTNLNLSGNCASDCLFMNIEPGQLQFPVLEKLKIDDRCKHFCTNYDFLLGMPNLRDLKVTLWVPYNFRNVEFMERGFLKLTDYLKEDGTLNYDSFESYPIWNQLPKLKRVKIRKLDWVTVRSSDLFY